MRNELIAVAALFVIVIMIRVLWLVFATPPGRHHAPSGELTTGEAEIQVVRDNTEQMSWADRTAIFNQTNERLALANEISLAPTMQELWADVARWDAFLNTGTLAVAEWLLRKEAVCS